MATDPKSDKQNVVDLAKVRKQMQTLKGQESKAKDSLKGLNLKLNDGAGKRPGASKTSKTSPKTFKRTVWDYVQLVFFLAMGAYMLQLCSGNSGFGGL